MKPRVLFLAPVEPWCRENGSSVITADLLEGLARSGGVELLPLFLRRPPAGFEPQRPERFSGFTLGVEGLPRWASVAWALARGTSPMRVRFANGQVARRIATAVTENGFSPTLVHVEHLPLVDIGLRLAKLYGCAVVYRAHNIESQLWARRLGRPSLLRRAVIRRMDDMEADAMNACAATLCISDVDLAWARAHAPAAAVELLPCSLLLDRYDSVRSEHDTAEPRICFVGGLEWGPNEVGLRWFVQEVLPLVVQQVPQATLAVLARGATERPWLTDNPAVRVVPQESKAVSLFASSSVSVAPLLQGGGVRIKIPESLAVGCPVVATTIGGEGLDLPGLTRTDDPAEFARACVHHLRQARTSESRAMLRDAVNANHGATVLAERLIDTWRRIARAGYRPNSPLVEV